MHLIESNESLKTLIVNILSKEYILGLDIESTGLDPFTSRLLLIQLSTSQGIFIINAGKVESKLIKYMLEVLFARNVLIIGHNLKFDIKHLYHNYGILLINLFDTMLAEVLQFAGVSKPYNSLAYVVKNYTGEILDKDVRKSFENRTDSDFSEEELVYAARDVEFLKPVYDKQKLLLASNQSERVWKLESRLEPVVAMMEYHGVFLEPVAWSDLSDKSLAKSEELSFSIRTYLAEHFDTIAGVYTTALDAADNLHIPLKGIAKRAKYSSLISKDEIISAIVPMINMNSYVQSKIVLNKLGVETSSSSKKELQKFKNQDLVSMLFEYRANVKATTAFGEEFLNAINPVTGRIHTEYNQLRAATGRFGSNNPNLQNIKSDTRYRHCFLSRDGYRLATIDYSQIELRILAEVSGEPLMIEAFQNGKDLHALTASIIFEKPLEKVTGAERSKGKSINFAVVYGTSEYGLQYNFGWSLEQGSTYLKRYFNTYKTLNKFIRAAGDRVVQLGYSSTQFGRKRYFTIPKSVTKKDLPLIKKVKRMGVNHIIQGGSADMIKIGLCEMFYNNAFDADRFHPDLFRVLQTTHDEDVVEFRDDIEESAVEYIGINMRDAAKPFLSEVPVDYKIKVDKCWSKGD